MVVLLILMFMVGVFVFTYSIFMLFRNEWVCRVRLKCLDDSKWNGSVHEPYNRLPSYDDMLRKFWIWDVNKFLQ